jgi:hypothetical protein
MPIDLNICVDYHSDLIVLSLLLRSLYTTLARDPTTECPIPCHAEPQDCNEYHPNVDRALHDLPVQLGSGVSSWLYSFQKYADVTRYRREILTQSVVFLWRNGPTFAGIT